MRRGGGEGRRERERERKRKDGLYINTLN